MMGVIEWIGFCHIKINITPSLQIRNMNGGQAAATSENSVSCARQTVTHRDGGQATATSESPVSYAHHTVGNREGSQAAATRESLPSYIGNRIGNSHRDKVVTAVKCTVSYSPSAIFYNITTLILIYNFQ